MIKVCAVLVTSVFFAVPFTMPQDTVPHPKPESIRRFENDRVRVEVPEGWSARAITIDVSGDKPFKYPIGAVFTKGKYRLFLVTHDQQASGIIGGRFAEIVEYVSPWLNKDDYPYLCLTKDSKATVSRKLSRVDRFFNTIRASSEIVANCGDPDVKGNLWYGSYFLETCNEKDPRSFCGGFFLEYQSFSGRAAKDRTVNGVTMTAENEMVYALTYDTTTPNELPFEDDPSLRVALREATQIVSTVVYK